MTVTLGILLLLLLFCLNDISQGYLNDNSSYILVRIPPPVRKFHSNHWFHLGEHYLSSFDKNLVSSNLCRNKIAIGIVDNRSFFSYSTSMTLYLLMLSVSQHCVFDEFIITDCKVSSSECMILSYSPLEIIGRQFRREMCPKGALCERMSSVLNRRDSDVELGSIPISSSLWFKEDINSVTRFQARSRSFCSSSYTHYQFLGEEFRGRGDDQGFVPFNVSSSFGYSLFPSVFRSNSSDVAFLPLTSWKAVNDNSSEHKLRLLIYQRDSNRRFAAFDNLVETLKKSLSDHWDIGILNHREWNHPCLVVKLLMHADVFLTTHGFQSTGVVFMKPGALLFEIFPYKYFKPSYIPLCQTFQVHHRFLTVDAPVSWNRQYLRVISTKDCMKDIHCRSHARGDFVSLTDAQIRQIVDTLTDHRRQKLPH